MSLVRAKAALQDCRNHIDSLQRPSPQVEAILSSYVCAVIYADLEAEVIEIAAARASLGSTDTRITAWARHSARRIIRSIKISELSGIAGNFHGDCKERFQLALQSEDKAAWDQIINNRHGLAHEQGQASTVSNMTFAEVESAFKKVPSVLEALRTSLA